MTLDRTKVERLFRLLENSETTPEFFAHVADDVEWTVMGTHPLAGTFTSKAAYLDATFGRLTPLMRSGTHVELVSLSLDGNTAVAELMTHSVTLEGARRSRTGCAGCATSTATRSCGRAATSIRPWSPGPCTATSCVARAPTIRAERRARRDDVWRAAGDVDRIHRVPPVRTSRSD